LGELIALLETKVDGSQKGEEIGEDVKRIRG